MYVVQLCRLLTVQGTLGVVSHTVVCVNGVGLDRAHLVQLYVGDRDAQIGFKEDNVCHTSQPLYLPAEPPCLRGAGNL